MLINKSICAGASKNKNKNIDVEPYILYTKQLIDQK